jgi:protein ImuA
MLALSSQRETVESLRQRLRASDPLTAGSFSSGCPALDLMLPGHALRRGSLIEYLADFGCGASALALLAAREACRDEAALVIVDQARSFYPPALANLGIGSHTIYVRPRTKRDQLWALHQSLRCQGVAAVLSWPDKLNDRAFRSLQLAAENGGAVGLFVRPLRVRGDPTWSALQLLVEPLPAVDKIRRLRVHLVRCRNAPAGASVDLELDDETGKLQASRAVSLAASVAASAGTNRSARA